MNISSPFDFTITSSERIFNKQTNHSFDIYHIVIKGPSNYTKNITKRFSDFKEFEKLWRSLYPNIDTELPEDRWFASRETVIEERKRELPIYLNNVIKIKALHLYLSEFLGIEKSIIENAFNYDGKKPKSSINANGQNGREAAKSTATLPAFNQSGQSNQPASNSLSTQAAPKNPNAITHSIPNYPAPKPKVVNIPKARVDYDYDAATETEISAKAGEIVTIINDSDELWLFIENSKKVQGYCPRSYCTKL